MLIEEVTPNIRQFYLTQEKSDKDYGSCLWAKITFDLTEYTMLAESDCGNYTYGWVPTPQIESFLHLMCRVDEDYLLGKISNESEFYLEESKKGTLNNIENNCYFESEDNFKDISKEINDIEDCGEELFFTKCDDICGRYDIADSFELIECVKRYPASAVKFVNIFCNILQPYLRKIQEDK